MTQIDCPILVWVYLNRVINPRRLKSPNSIAGHGRARKENTVSFLVLNGVPSCQWQYRDLLSLWTLWDILFGSSRKQTK